MQTQQFESEIYEYFRVWKSSLEFIQSNSDIL